MKGISCNSNFLADWPIDDAIQMLADHGYEGIDICLEISPPFDPVPTPHMSPRDDLATRERVRAKAEQAGVAIAALNAHDNISVRNAEKRGVAREFLEGSVRLAADLGCETVDREVTRRVP